MAERLITLLRDDALRARLGAAGRAWVERDWRWDVSPIGSADSCKPDRCDIRRTGSAESTMVRRLSTV